ncbi:MAG: UDP-N-acetylmuramate dehydrogenase [Pseudomonadota bacterium]
MTREQKDELVRLLPEAKVSFDESMSGHCSIGAGGPAEAFVVVEKIDELKRVIEWSSEKNIDYRFWGGGGNMLVRDGGVRGLVIKLGESFSSIEVERESGNDVFVKAGAATSTAELARWSADAGLSGLACLAGVRGTVGGNLIMNAATSAGAIGDAVEELSIIDREGRELTLKRSALHFEYRRLKLPRTAAVIRCLLRLERTGIDEAKAALEEAMKKRSEAQPAEAKSLGCVFKNPGKTPAGVLIEDAGLKGVRVGGARVSTIHANFIVNEGKAASRDITVLMGLVRERVKENSSVVLEPEIQIIGDE